MFELAISAEGLHKSYGSVHALRGIDLAVPAGTILGLQAQRRREDLGRPHPQHAPAPGWRPRDVRRPRRPA